MSDMQLAIEAARHMFDESEAGSLERLHAVEALEAAIAKFPDAEEQETEGIGSTLWKHFARNPSCPDCGNLEFHSGPQGGLSKNIKCAGCGSEFNVGPGMAERIEKHRSRERLPAEREREEEYRPSLPPVIPTLPAPVGGTLRSVVVSITKVPTVNLSLLGVLDRLRAALDAEPLPPPKTPEDKSGSDPLREEVEQLQVQLAGCLTAAEGATSEDSVAQPDAYGWSLAYQTVLNLRREFDYALESLSGPVALKTGLTAGACELLHRKMCDALKEQVVEKVLGGGLSAQPEPVRARAAVKETIAWLRDLQKNMELPKTLRDEGLRWHAANLEAALAQPIVADQGALRMAARQMDWKQAFLNRRPPCFHIEESGRFCGRADVWQGHRDKTAHGYIDLAAALTQESPAPDVAGEELARAVDGAAVFLLRAIGEKTDRDHVLDARGCHRIRKLLEDALSTYRMAHPKGEVKK